MHGTIAFIRKKKKKLFELGVACILDVQIKYIKKILRWLGDGRGDTAENIDDHDKVDT